MATEELSQDCCVRALREETAAAQIGVDGLSPLSRLRRRLPDHTSATTIFKGNQISPFTMPGVPKCPLLCHTDTQAVLDIIILIIQAVKYILPSSAPLVKYFRERCLLLAPQPGFAHMHLGIASSKVKGTAQEDFGQGSRIMCPSHVT